MLKMTTCGWCVWEGDEKDGVDIFSTKSLCDGVAVRVDVEKRICGWKGAKGGLDDWAGVCRVEDDESIDGHDDDGSVSASGETSRRTRLYLIFNRCPQDLRVGQQYPPCQSPQRCTLTKSAQFLRTSSSSSPSMKTFSYL